MEAVPRVPMLYFELRTSPEKVEFSTKLKQYIRSHYNEDPTLYAAGITGIEAMRKEAVDPSKTVLGCSLLKRYYCQLHFMASRFPMREDEEAAVCFSWNSLHSSSVVTLNDISLEMASILYNIGALHTQLGAMDNRTTAEGMKMSCTHFQCAAWAFEHINEKFSFPKHLGFSPVLMSFMCQLCLAQAQECILEKSMMDNRKSAITAKVGTQVVEYYKQSLSLLMEWPQSEDAPAEIICLKVYKTWAKYLHFKIAYYESLSLLFQGQQSEDQQKMGERVAYYQAAFDKLEEARKLPPGVENTESVLEALTFVCDVIEGKRKAAKNENEFIYHESIPHLSHLPKIKGASLVKGIPFNINDSEVCGPDLFSSIVPMQAHESASLYSEEKAKLLRKVNGMIENKDEELETFLSMLDLDEIKSKMDGNKLPQELIDRCAVLSAKSDAIQQLTDTMGKLSDIYQDVNSMLDEIKDLLKEEEHHEKEYQQILGERPPSIAATDLTREAKKYQEAHAKASESNQTLHKAMMMHVSNLKLLSLPLKELLPHIPLVAENPDGEAITKEMEHLVSKVEEMKKQRFMLASQLRDLARRDDITTLVITYSGDKMDELFERELKKYDKCVSLIEQNLAAQENILRALKESYARYGATRKTTGESQRRRALMISSLLASYDAYEDLLSKSTKGLDFYKKLQTNVSKLLQRVKGTCKVQDEEREQMLKNINKSDSDSHLSEVPATNVLKLKDYLNLKKETGKLTLSHPASMSSGSPVFNDPASHASHNWIPDTRPTPVGSEETATSHSNPSDSFHGFYQGQGKDQVWNSSSYSTPQASDQKLRYFMPQPVDASGNPTNSSFPSSCHPDAYPISSYSTNIPKPEGRIGYEPKTNYYEINQSPNRYYTNPAQPYSPSVSVSSTTDVSYAAEEPPGSQASENATYRRNAPDVTSYYPYSSPIQVTYPFSQQPYPPNFVPQLEPTIHGTYTLSQSYETQPSSYNPQSFAQGSLSYGAVDSDQHSYPSPTHTPLQPHDSSAYSSFVSVHNQTPPVSSAAVDQIPAVNASPYTQLPYPPSASTDFTSEKLYDFSNPQNYQSPKPTYAVSTQVGSRPAASQSNYPYAAPLNSPYMPSYHPPDSSLQYGAGADNVESWSRAPSLPAPNQQYLQSGNESLYTSSRTPNQYAITNSDVYKIPDPPNSNYQTYGNQYYNSQYGAYNGQLDAGSQAGYSPTYMQAGADKNQAITNTTFSISQAKSSPTTNPSNIDLLAGLDFNLSHSPLVPETPSIKEDPIETKPDGKAPEHSSVEKRLAGEGSAEKEGKVCPQKSWMSNPDGMNAFVQEVEKFEKFVDGLTLKTLSGPTNLDLKWKEVVDVQEKVSPHHIISVARCYPMKNRFPDILPYDDSRIELPSTKDDYINASRMSGLTELSPSFILTQAPLPSTYADFWAMVFEHQVEVVVCLLNDNELDDRFYWPREKNQELEMGKLRISLQSSNIRSHWVERILSISQVEGRSTRVVVHMQFTAWPGSTFPESPAQFLSFSEECRNYFRQQRSYSHPVVVHCISGVGRTGLFCLIIASILDILAGNGIADLSTLAGRMCHFRKSCLRDREHLKFAYQAVLFYCQELLSENGIRSNRASLTLKETKPKDEISRTNHSIEGSLGASSASSAGLCSEMQCLAIDSNGEGEKTNKRSEGHALRLTSETPSEIQSVLDANSFTLGGDPSKSATSKTSTPDMFSKTLSSDATSSNDPLSRLDPFWTMKK